MISRTRHALQIALKGVFFRFRLLDLSEAVDDLLLVSYGVSILVLAEEVPPHWSTRRRSSGIIQQCLFVGNVEGSAEVQEISSRVTLIVSVSVSVLGFRVSQRMIPS